VLPTLSWLHSKTLPNSIRLNPHVILLLDLVGQEFEDAQLSSAQLDNDFPGQWVQDWCQCPQKAFSLSHMAVDDGTPWSSDESVCWNTHRWSQMWPAQGQGSKRQMPHEAEKRGCHFLKSQTHKETQCLCAIFYGSQSADLVGGNVTWPCKEFGGHVFFWQY
jgi:hypothetical protein